jgi:hypothetical protein
MRHYKVCIYDYSDSEYVNHWTTLQELITSIKTEGDFTGLPSSYLTIEKDFIEFAINFLLVFKSENFKFMYLNIYSVKNTKTIDSTMHAEVYEGLVFPLGITKDLTKETLFEDLGFLDKLTMIQLCARCILEFCIESEDTGIRLSSMCDGFYWYVALPDDMDPKLLTTSPNLYIYDWYDIFE